jgi:hypothetical protein
MLKKLTNKLKRFSPRAMAATGAMLLIFQVFAPVTLSGGKVYADGEGSPDACLDTTANVHGSVEGTDDLVTKDVGAGNVVTGVCIKSGSNMFDGKKHSEVLVNGTYEDACFKVEGVGTQTVTVTRLSSGPDCQEISHIDVVYEKEEEEEPKGSLKVSKKVDSDGDNVYEGGNTEANTLGFKWGLDGGATNKDMGTTVNDLSEGNHTVTENDVTDYNFTGWYYTYKTESNSCANPVGTTLPLTTEVVKDKTTYITLCNQKEKEVKGKITVHKVTYPSNDPTEFSITAAGTGNIEGNATRTLTTAQDVVYNVGEGSYDVSEQVPEGWEQVSNNCNDLVIDAQNLEASCTIKNKKLNGISGHKFEDKNGNGNWDQSEPTLEGWAVNLYSCQKNEVELDSFTSFNAVQQLVECDETPADSTVTDENGNYSFDNLQPGSYKVCEVNQAGWTQTYPTGNDGCHMVEICRPGESASADFGNFKKAQVNGFKWNDANGNATPDTGESKLSGWTITLYKDNGEGEWTQVDTTKTDANGDYSFTGLEVGDYRVCETQQAGWTRTFPAKSDCQDFSVEESGQECIANFGNKEVPQVLETSTPVVAEIVNTGANSIPSMLVGLMILGILGTVTRWSPYGRKFN